MISSGTGSGRCRRVLPAVRMTSVRFIAEFPPQLAGPRRAARPRIVCDERDYLAAGARRCGTGGRVAYLGEPGVESRAHHRRGIRHAQFEPGAEASTRRQSTKPLGAERPWWTCRMRAILPSRAVKCPATRSVPSPATSMSYKRIAQIDGFHVHGLYAQFGLPAALADLQKHGTAVPRGEPRGIRFRLDM
jgi:hypothetical protein